MIATKPLPKSTCVERCAIGALRIVRKQVCARCRTRGLQNRNARAATAVGTSSTISMVICARAGRHRAVRRRQREHVRLGHRRHPSSRSSAGSCTLTTPVPVLYPVTVSVPCARQTTGPQGCRSDRVPLIVTLATSSRPSMSDSVNVPAANSPLVATADRPTQPQPRLEHLVVSTVTVGSRSDP